MTTPSHFGQSHTPGPQQPPSGSGSRQPPQGNIPPQPPAAGPLSTPPPAATGGTAKPARRDGRRGRLFTGGAAVVAVLLALVAVMLAWRANSRANEAFDKASAPIAAQPATQAPTDQPVTTVPATTEPDTTEPSPDETGTPTLDAQTKFKAKYSGQSLRISTSRCGDSTNIDLDEPRVGVDSTTRDLTVEPACSNNGAAITLNTGVDGSRASSPNVQPVECANLIRLSPVPAGAQALRTGQIYCINTSRDAAKVTANTWKMVVLEVTAIAQDGTVTFKASAWDIPL